MKGAYLILETPEGGSKEGNHDREAAYSKAAKSNVRRQDMNDSFIQI